MDIELKTKWVEALRSGEFKQGPEYLRHEPWLFDEAGARTGERGTEQFCCLGVLCKVAGLDEKLFTDKMTLDQMQDEVWDSIPQVLSLIEAVGPYSKRTLEEPMSQQRKLAQLNDVDKRNFNEIALYIERML